MGFELIVAMAMLGQCPDGVCPVPQRVVVSLPVTVEVKQRTTKAVKRAPARRAVKAAVKIRPVRRVLKVAKRGHQRRVARRMDRR